ncbi:HlyD family secretion protein [Sphingobacterium cellulitidis]|nr:efflux RND transporter periplasmic adaptor subunit [Sphingobacterium soli]MBA8986392.1 multidrug resistance efflux pump [Sphingobacterium soli]
MRKIINSLGVVAYSMLFLGLFGCNNAEKEKTKENQAAVSPVYQHVIAIGKVLPEDGWVQISSAISAEVKEIFVKEGDEVEEGEILMKLKESSVGLDIKQSEAQLESLRSQHQSSISDLAKEEIILEELRSKYEITKALYERNAETKENAQKDLSNLKQQQELIAGLKSQIRANQASEREQSIVISKNRENLKDFQVTALKKGIISELNVQLGQTVNSTDDLGKIVNNQNIIIEAEVDELFADSVDVGQLVDINLVGKTAVIGKGKIIYVSPTLMNKSILFETSNEAEDRRVRRIRIEPDSNSSLLINSKVECRIKI